jgi:hypothetical protein
MFQGFEGYPYYIGATMDELGAVRNDTTNTDHTNYFEVVPARTRTAQPRPRDAGETGGRRPGADPFASTSQRCPNAAAPGFP